MQQTFSSRIVGIVFIILVFTIADGNVLYARQVQNQDVINIGARRELFVDNYLVEHLTGKTELRLHQPTPQNVALVTDAAWEGNGTNYITVFKDNGKYRMYYRACHYSYIKGKDRPNTKKDIYCYAESLDGIHWTKPSLGQFSWKGSAKNNIILNGMSMHAFSPFHDENPACTPDAKYKAIGYKGEGKQGLYAFKSADGIRWTLMDTLPVITKGAFDSQNLAFWDAERGEYRGYHRDFLGGNEVDLVLAGGTRGRDVRTETSVDFLHWTAPEFLQYTAVVDTGKCGTQVAAIASTSPTVYPAGRVSELYTNQIIPYYRAPHLMIGFPTRYTDRGWTESAKALPRYDYRKIRAKDSRREGTAITDGMFMTSRDRNNFSIWPESFLRPGYRTTDTWFYGDMYQNWGLVETKSAIEDAPPELSIYVTERTLQEKGAVIRRYTLRLDGFVSVHAPLAGGELITKPLIFAGNQLRMNVSTSAAGTVRVEVQNSEGQPLPGFSLADCYEIYGDDYERTVGWKGNPDLGALAGKPVRLKFEVKDADIYSFIFQQHSR